MKILALNSIRHNGFRWKAGTVCEIDDVRGATLIAQGFAQEASASAQVTEPTPVQRDTNKLISQVVEGAAQESVGRGRRGR